MIFKNWLEHYLFTFKRNNVKNSTYLFYCEMFKALQPLYDIELDSLDVFAVQQLINSMHASGFAYSTIKHVFELVNQACKKAFACKLIRNNPCDGVELPHAHRREIECLSEFEIRQLLHCSDRNYYYPVFLFLLFSGLRVGELIALGRDDIDIQNNVIHINKNFYRGELSTPKTNSGFRSVPLSAELRSLLPVPLSDIVFANTLGKRIDYHALLTSWHRQQSGAGFIRLHGLHSLRHTFATNLIHNGADVKTVSVIMGHRDIQTTLNYYCHADIEDERHAMDLLTYSDYFMGGVTNV